MSTLISRQSRIVTLRSVIHSVKPINTLRDELNTMDENEKYFDEIEYELMKLLPPAG